MCGIAGILSFDPKEWPVNEETIINMRDTMIHRGPDGAGTWINETSNLGFGHRRLAIIDLSDSASQPMTLPDGSITIIFNGEIYNHSDLRQELISLGHQEWETDHSDTEVILHAFKEWGIDCVKRFNGMFSIAIWDKNKGELWLIRDRIGIKPLYYALDHRGIVFASEIKAILAGPDRKRAVNEEAFFHYLSFLTTPAPMTLFEGINKLPGGTWAMIKKTGEVKFNTWWDPWDEVSTPTIQHTKDILSDVFSNLKNSVELRKISDVPIGVFLSGGIDSSINIALFSDGDDKSINAFSIGYPRDQKSISDELPYARIMAKRVQAEHYEYLIDQEDLIDFLPDMIRYQDEPIADPVCIPVYFVSKLAKDNGITVCQVGEGADELFCGYTSWRTFLKLQKASSWPFPRQIKKLGVKVLTLFGLGDRLFTEFLRRSSENLPIFWGGAEAFTEKGKQKILSPRLKKKFSGRSSWEIISPIFSKYKKNAKRN